MDPQKSKITPKDFFLWAGAMVTLYASIFAFIWLLFSYIDYTFPNVLQYQPDPYAGGLPYQMSALIVLVPVFLVLMRLIRRSIAADPTRGDIWIRRWALFLTLFAAGASMVIDLIVLIHKFLSGQELTTGFILKIVVVLLIAGAVFLHFLADLRGYWKVRPDRAKMVGFGAGLVVLVGIVAGFFIVGTPSDARAMRLDNERVNGLQTIQWQIINYWQQKERLPANLEDLQDPLSGFVIPRDPQTGEPFTYSVKGPLTFELCATFGKAGQSMNSYARPAMPIAVDMTSKTPYETDSWQHEAGEQCFERTIDPERYPPFPDR